ncbi:MAG: nicotinate (nicotinamide) nucleotide adenylyltransferase [Alphaproteobacteria bacterium]
MKPIHTRYRTIGLLGGSFNPAHAGHLHISLYALKKLGLDGVWWLVSPQNPLKDKTSLAEYEKRFASAKALAKHPKIIVSDIERQKELYYTYKTLKYLKQRYPATRFIWMMGADNLVHFNRWQNWRRIVNLVPVMVLDRVPYSNAALHSSAAHYMRKFIIKNINISTVPAERAFLYYHLKPMRISSTEIRKTLGKDAFLRHT